MLVTSPRSLLIAELDDTGALIALEADGHRFAVRMQATLVVGGTERRAPLGGLEYPGTTELTGATLAGEPRRRCVGLDDETIVPTQIGGWSVDWHHLLRGQDAPGLGVALEVQAPDEGERVLRDLVLTLDVDLPDGSWTLDVPGGQVRPGIAVAELPERLWVAPAAGVPGSTGLIALSNGTSTLVLWGLCRTEIGGLLLCPTPTGVRLVQHTQLAGEPRPGERLRIEPLQVHVADGDYASVRAQLPQWYAALDLRTPENPPAWATRASMFEVQLGYSVFRGGHEYGPYRTLADLRADLDRIGALGFSVLQIMPRQPYPSYNVHDYADIATSYAPEDELRDFVDECHRRGIRVILDILMHGVMDHEAIDAAAAGVRSGPYAERLDAQGRVFEGDDADFYPIAWSRHILDFEEHWRGGSPERTPLLDEHPDWFFRLSDGSVGGVYTEAFDARTGFADHFIDACVMLVERLGIDGFRFDAPTYNDFANWSPATRHRASASPLACVELFRRLRPRLRGLRDDLLMYTEPSGVVLRQSMDLNYNYDEQWLLGAVVQPRAADAGWSVRDGADLVAWYRERDAALPPGSLTAHHIDSHDTFWWPMWGAKWRREQFGLAATRALTAVSMSLGGPYMLFIGGEEGVEDVVTTFNVLKRQESALALGRASFELLAPEQRTVFSVVHRHQQQTCVVLVNLADEPATAEVTWPEAGEWIDIAGLADDLGRASGAHSAVDLPAWGIRVLVKG